MYSGTEGKKQEERGRGREEVDNDTEARGGWQEV